MVYIAWWSSSRRIKALGGAIAETVYEGKPEYL